MRDKNTRKWTHTLTRGVHLLFIAALVMGLALVAAPPVVADNSESSSTMIFEGTLTDEGGGVYSGVLPMVDEATAGLGDNESGYDVYARNGASAWFGDDPGSGPTWDEVVIGTGSPSHDAWATWDPDTPDWYQYSLNLYKDDGEYKWAVRNHPGATAANPWSSDPGSYPAKGVPMSGAMDWTDMYAEETDTGAYLPGTGTAEIPGGAAGKGGGPACWDMDWSWGSEVVPLAFPGFDVAMTDLGGDYRVTLTPAQGPAGVSPPGPVVNEDTGESYGTIQAAIDAATAGDTINVAAGTYDETITLATVDNLTISGDPANRPVIDGGVKFENTTPINGITFENLYFKGTARPAPNERIFWNANTAAINDFIMDNCVLDGENVSGRHGIAGDKFGQSFSITDSEFKNILSFAVMDIDSSSDYSPHGGNGLQLTTVTFANNNIHDCNGSVALRGHYVDKTATVNVYDNAWDNIGGNSGETGEQWAAVEVNHAVNVNVYDNTVNDVAEGLWGEGQAIQFWDITTLDVHDNMLTNNYEGIFVFCGDAGNPYGGPYAVPDGYIYQNTISGNSQYGLKMESTCTGASPLNTETNWWGDATGPDTTGVTAPDTNPHGAAAGGDKAIGNVDAIPWYATSTTTNLTENIEVVHNPTIAWSDTIQGGVDAALAGDTINVAAGTYDERVDVEKSDLSLSGPNAGVNPNTGTRGTEAIIQPTGEPGWPQQGAVSILSDGVTFDGFEVDASLMDTSTSDTNVINVYGASDVTVKNNIAHGATSGSWAGMGIAAWDWTSSSTVDNATIENNLVYDTGRMGIFCMDYDTDNSEYDLTEGHTITGNTVYETWKKGDEWGDAGGAIQINVGKDSAITDNTVYNTQDGNRGIYMFGSGSGNTITGNTVRDNPTGIELWISGEGGTTIDWEGDIATSPGVHFNNIYDNTDFGAVSTNIAGTDMVMDAENNWWGDASGPYHDPDNISGTGDPVSDNVDFDPWIGAETDAVADDTLGNGESVSLPDGEASATYNSGAGGSATVTLAKYTGNPGTDVPGVIGDDAGNYFDVNVADNTDSDATLTLTFYADADGGDPLYWYNGTAWRQVIDNDGNVPTADDGGDYIDVVFGPDSSPTLDELTGTPFSPGEPFGIAGTPSVKSLVENDTMTVEVTAKATDLWAVDFTLDFPHDILEATNVELPSESSDAGMNAFFVTKQDLNNTDDPDEGTVRIAYTQDGSADDPASADDFLLATITFRAKAGNYDPPVSGAMSIGDVTYSDRNGIILGDASSVEMLMIDPDTGDPADNSLDITVSDANSVSGTIALQGRDPGDPGNGDYSGVTARLTPGNHTDTTDGVGNFTIQEVPAGDGYLLRVSIAKYLAAEKLVDVPETGNSTGNDVELLGGDINQDDRINIQDLAIMGSRFGAEDGDPNWDDGLADINSDDIVNIQDLAIAGGNFGQDTDSAYGSW